jgi:hypothetical protein
MRAFLARLDPPGSRDFRFFTLFLNSENAGGGRVPKNGGNGVQFDDLCKLLVERWEFSGDEFSWGDARIGACANGKESNGNASVWTAVGTSHHLAFVRPEIANLRGS